MNETIDKILMAALGAANVTRERAEKLFQECVRRGEAGHADREKFVRGLVDSAKKAKRDLEKSVGAQVRSAASKLQFARKQDLDRVEAKLDKLLRQRRRK